jgi:hypothetical protein
MVVMRPLPTRVQRQRALDDVARRNYGVLWKEVLTDLGVTRAQVRTYLRRGEWRVVSRGVFVVCSVPTSWEQELMAICRRAPGRTWVTGRAAARLWSLDGFEAEAIEISTTANLRGLRAEHLVRVVRLMPPSDVTVLRRLPVSTVHRTLIDVGDRSSLEEVELAYECARRRQQTTDQRLHRRINELGTGPHRSCHTRQDHCHSRHQSAHRQRP